VEGSTGRRWRSGLPACAGAVVVGLVAGTGPGRTLDRRLYRALNRSAGRAADLLLGSVTELGSIWASVGAAATVAVAGRRRREALDALGAAMAMWALGQGLKRVFARPRPYEGPEPIRLLIARPKGTSWPSSHPAVLLAFCTVLARDLRLPGPLRRNLMALAALVGVSRIYLGVHYPADVVGGVLLGRGVADLWSGTVSPLAVRGFSGGGPR
jgi:membrane-associated phospholipid phosphatase